jgi:recombination protein RecT
VQNNFVADLEEYAPNFRDALPEEISLPQFKRIVITAVSLNPDLLYANRRSLWTACMRAAFDGLMPDGREAALVVYNTEVKQRNPETGLDEKRRLDMVQYLPMTAGIRKRMRNTGEVLSAIAEAVWSNDKFRYSLGDQPFIEHEAPPLNEERGEVIGAYAIIRLANGEVIRDVMGKKEIEAARAVSRAKDGPMWTNFYWEGAKKTVLRRASKQAPLSPTMRRLINREDEDPEDIDLRGGAIAHEPTREPEPQQPIGQQRSIEHAQDDRPEFTVVDLDGVITTLRDGQRTAELIADQIAEAAKQGLKPLEGFWETNVECVQSLAINGFPDDAADLTNRYIEASDELKKAAAQAEAERKAREQAAKEADERAVAAQRQREAEAARQADGASRQKEEGDQDRRVPRPVETTQQQSASQGNSAERRDPRDSLGGRDAGSAEPSSADDPTKDPLYIPMVMKGKHPNPRTWGVALARPKVLRLTTRAQAMRFTEVNEKQLDEFYKSCEADDVASLKEAIAHAMELGDG